MDKENMVRLMMSLMGLASGILLTYFTTVNSHSSELVRLSEQIASMREMLAEHTSVQYTQLAARSDFQRIQQQIDAHSVAIEKLDANQRRHEEIFHDLKRRKDE